MANLQFATRARDAVTKKPNAFPWKKGRCQQLQREVAVATYNSNRYFARADGTNPPDAVAAAAHLKATGRAHDYNGDPHSLELGDLLYKTVGSGGFGHVGTLVDKSAPDWRDWLVAENSTYHARIDAAKRGVSVEKGDARGIRTLGQFGAFQVVGRLPSIDAAVISAPPISAPIAAPPPEPETPLCVWNGDPFPALFDGEGRPYVQLAALIAKMGQTVVKTGNHLGDNPPRFYVTSGAVAK